MKAVVDEQFGLADLPDQRWQQPPLLAFEVRPARAARVGDGDAGLPVQLGLRGCGRSMLQRCPMFRQSPSSAIRLLIPWATPVSITTSGRRAHGARYCAAQLNIGIAVPAVGMTASTEPLRGQQRADLRQQPVDLLSLQARPWCPEQAVQMLIPVVVEVRLFPRRLPSPLSPFAWQSPSHLRGTGGELAQNGKDFAHQRPRIHLLHAPRHHAWHRAGQGLIWVALSAAFRPALTHSVVRRLALAPAAPACLSRRSAPAAPLTWRAAPIA